MVEPRRPADDALVERTGLLSIGGRLRILRESSRARSADRAAPVERTDAAAGIQHGLPGELRAERPRCVPARVRPHAAARRRLRLRDCVRVHALPPLTPQSPAAPVVVLDAGRRCRAPPVRASPAPAMGGAVRVCLADAGIGVRLLLLLPLHLHRSLARLVRAPLDDEADWRRGRLVAHCHAADGAVTRRVQAHSGRVRVPPRALGDRVLQRGRRRPCRGSAGVACVARAPRDRQARIGTVSRRHDLATLDRGRDRYDTAGAAHRYTSRRWVGPWHGAVLRLDRCRDVAARPGAGAAFQRAGDRRAGTIRDADGAARVQQLDSG